MAKTKAELQNDSNRHRAIVAQARKAVTTGEIQKAVDLAVTALEYVDGMMQYVRRYEDRAEINSVDSVDLILKYAPLLFDSWSLEKVAELLKSQRRVEKNTTADVGMKLENACRFMWDAHRFWTLLEQHGTIKEDELAKSLGGPQGHWRHLVEAWDQMGLLRCKPVAGKDMLSFATNLDEDMDGKCPVCGHVQSAPKIDYMRESTCAHCNAIVHFVLMEVHAATR